MNRFPLCIELEGRPVFLVGSGPQIREKAERLAPFRPRILRLEHFTEAEAAQQPALVITGDLPAAEAARIHALCVRSGIPVNVADMPEYCTFHFPALVTAGDLTIAVSTGGACPGAASYLRRRIQEALPDRTEEILDWLSGVRAQLKAECSMQTAKVVLAQLTDAAFRAGRPLTKAETDAVRRSAGDA